MNMDYRGYIVLQNTDLNWNFSSEMSLKSSGKRKTITDDQANISLETFLDRFANYCASILLLHAPHPLFFVTDILVQKTFYNVWKPPKIPGNQDNSFDMS